MDTFWIILAILIVGGLIVAAINRNTRVNVARLINERKYNEFSSLQEAAKLPEEKVVMTDEEAYHKAKKLIIERGSASTSLVQKHLKIGYIQAAQVIERMEQEGVISEADGKTPRKVIKNAD